jgi:AraC family transcriptional regulator
MSEPIRSTLQHINPLVGHGSAAISGLLQNSTLLRPSSVELEWANFAVERHTIRPGETRECTLDHHFLILWDVHVAEGEVPARGGRLVQYRKFPNTITTCVPGIRPAYRAANTHEVIVGALGADFVDGLETELDARPLGSLQPLYGSDDPNLRNLLRLLCEESESAGRGGRLYVDSLTTALGLRLLLASRSKKQADHTKVSPLPRRLLSRVLDRMRADLSNNVDLATLAAETGYSRAHFLRMFRAATGQSPHRYLLELRLAEAQALIASQSIPLTDVAAACGFSSHAHLTTAFRSRYGVTPSAYRRGLQRPAELSA